MSSKKEVLQSLGDIITIIGSSNTNEFKLLMDYYNNYCKEYSLGRAIDNLKSACNVIYKYNIQTGVDDRNRKYPMIKFRFDDVRLTFILHDDCSINWIEMDRERSNSYIYHNRILKYPDGLDTLSILDTCNGFDTCEEVLEYLVGTFGE